MTGIFRIVDSGCTTSSALRTIGLILMKLSQPVSRRSIIKKSTRLLICHGTEGQGGVLEKTKPVVGINLLKKSNRKKQVPRKIKARLVIYTAPTFSASNSSRRLVLEIKWGPP